MQGIFNWSNKCDSIIKLQIQIDSITANGDWACSAHKPNTSDIHLTSDPG